MPDPLRLLAKSRTKDGRELGVGAHCHDAATAAKRVFSGRTLDAWMRFFRIADQAAFLRDLVVACLFHDLGKANADFQDAVTKRKERQAIRHEHLSGLVLCLEPIRQWLMDGGCDYDAVVAAVLSHHAKVSGPNGDFPWAQSEGKPPIATYFAHADCRTILDKVAEVLHRSAPWPLPNDPWPSPVWVKAWNAGLDSADDLAIPDGETFDLRRNHMLAVKAATVVADAVASGLWREDRALDAFLGVSLHRPSLSSARIYADIIDPRINQLRRAGKWKDWSDFQAAADDLGDRAAIVAGCGTGKTLAAWRWAAAAADRQSLGSVIFLYPTRATATEGFKDYVAWAPEADAILLTGTASLDLAGMQANPPEPIGGKIYENETDARLFALANWKKTYFSATLDQFLSFLEHGYAGMCLLPQLADAAVIIDEVHSLDRHLFERLLALLTHFRGPVLLMSATMPRERMDKLRALGVRIFPDGPERDRFPDLAAEEDRVRYRLSRCSDRDHALAVARTSDEQQPRSTLWVVNTVKRCQALALAMRSVGIDPLVYHSRFTVRDRRRVHQAVIDAFQDPMAKRWGVTTQVCEMSLDLDADRLVSEDAPLPSLIQRLGRSNRKRISTDLAEVASGKARAPDFRAEVLIYQPEDANPYAHEDNGREAVEGAGRFATDHHDQELGQHALAAALMNDVYVPDIAQPQASAGFLSGGWFATAKPLRGDDNDLDVRCLLSTDLERGLTAKGMPGDSEPLDAWIINVPKRHVMSWQRRDTDTQVRERPAWMHAAHLHIADGGRYDSDLGFLLIELE